MIVPEVVFIVGVVAVALVVVPLVVVIGGSALSTLLLHDEPESYIGDRAARRSLLRG